jgi:hypothetical protein
MAVMTVTPTIGPVVLLGIDEREAGSNRNTCPGMVLIIVWHIDFGRVGQRRSRAGARPVETLGANATIEALPLQAPVLGVLATR